MDAVLTRPPWRGRPKIALLGNFTSFDLTMSPRPTRSRQRRANPTDSAFYAIIGAETFENCFDII